MDNVSKLSIPEVAKYLNNKFIIKMSVYAFQLLQHFVKLNQFILIMQILNQNVEFQLSGEKNLVDSRVQSVLVSDSCQEINKHDLILGKLPEFSPEYAAQANPPAASATQTDPNL